MRLHRPSRTLAALCLLPALAVVAGCGGTPDAPASPDTVGSTSPTESATSPAKPPSSTPPASPTAVPLADRLLATDQVPALNAQRPWQDGETGPATTDPFGVCAKADLASIGATDVVTRTFFPADDSDDLAAEQVAEFPDARTAATAWTVLKAWHDRCSGAMDTAARLQVGPLTTAPVPTGSARWYLVSWTPAGEETERFETFGTVLDGTRIAVLRMAHSGPDHRYPPGKDPMVGMVVAAAGRLSGTSG
jgi:hypothetical protein